MSESRLWSLIRQLQAALAGRRLVGPFTASSGALAAGGTNTITVTHNLGTTEYNVLGDPVDAGFGYSVNWIGTNRLADSVDIAFRNNGGIASAALTVEFFLFVA